MEMNFSILFWKDNHEIATDTVDGAGNDLVIWETSTYFKMAIIDSCNSLTIFICLLEISRELKILNYDNIFGVGFWGEKILQLFSIFDVELDIKVMKCNIE